MKLILFFLPWIVHAQTIRGVVLEKGTRTPLKEVNVYLIPHELKTQTNQRGEFELNQPPRGAANWVINVGGYDKLEQGDIIRDDNLNELRVFYVSKKSYQIFETTIYGQIKKRDPVTQSLKADFAANMPGSAGDPIKAVQNLPGVSRSSGFSSQVIIQGSSPNDTRYQLDGHEVPIIFHFGGLASVVPADALDRIDYLSAGYGPNNGRALGGIVGAWSKKPENDRFHLNAFVDLINSGISIQGPLGESDQSDNETNSNSSTNDEDKNSEKSKNPKASYYLGIRKSYVGEVLKAVVKDDGSFSLTAAPSYSDITLVYDRKFNERDQFHLLSVGSLDTFEFLLNDTGGGYRGDFYYKTAFYRLIPTWTHRHGENLVSNFSLGLGRDWIKVVFGDDFFNLRTTQLTMRAETEWSIPEQNLKTWFGLDNKITYARVELLLPQFNQIGGVANPVISGDKSDLALSTSSNQYAIYAQAEKKAQSWTLAPSMRLDYFDVNHLLGLSGRARVQKELSDYSSLRLLLGNYFQAPREEESAESGGNPNLKANQAFHASFKYLNDFKAGNSRGFDLETGLFYKGLWNLVIPSQEFVLNNGEIKPEYYNNQGRGKILGYEILLKYNFAPLSGWLAYTLSRGLRYEPGRAPYLNAFDQTHNINLVTAYDLSNQWRLSSRIRYVTGNPNTPITGGIYDNDNDSYFPVRGPFYSTRVNPFVQLDLRLDKKWIYNTWVLTAYLDIQNLTNRQNVESVSYSYDYRQSANVTGLPIIPILGVKGEF